MAGYSYKVSKYIRDNNVSRSHAFLSRGFIRKAYIINALITVSFILSFSLYFFPLSSFLMSLPVILMLVSACIAVIFSTPSKFEKILVALLKPESILFIFALPLFPTVSSLITGNTYAFNYGCLMISSLLAIRILLCVVTIEDILLSYFNASIICVILFVIFSAKGIIDAASGDYRLFISSFHPNLIAFIVAGFIPVHLWKYQNSKKINFYLLILIFFDFLIIFYASSRGSLGAVLSGAVIIISIYCLKHLSSGRIFFFNKKSLIYFTISILICFILLIIKPDIYNASFIYIIDKLELFNEYRGLDTGLTGRIPNWINTVNALDLNTLFFGKGFRTGASDFDFSIDNGYLVILYEMGIVAMISITLKYIWSVFYCIFKFSYTKSEKNRIFYITIAFILIIFLVNNLVARYLFGLGNPFSLLALFFLLLSKHEMVMTSA